MKAKFFTARYFGTWISLGILRACCLLPYSLQIRLGNALGYIMYRLMPRRRRIARVNIDLCFPQLSAAEKKQLIKGCFQSTAISIFEISMSWWGSQRKLRKLYKIEGIEHLKTALHSGKGVILLSAHFTCLELGGRLLAMENPFAVMYKKHKNDLMEHFIISSRTNHYQKAIKQDDSRGFIRALKQNMAIWYAPDQDLGERRSVWANFMGVNTATLTAPARFAKISGAAVVPFFALRNKDNSGYTLTLLPALEDFPEDEERENATRINNIISDFIQQAPEQYLWLHRRFKTRPAGEPSFYS